jgi:hypothetical protein
VTILKPLFTRQFGRAGRADRQACQQRYSGWQHFGHRIVSGRRSRTTAPTNGGGVPTNHESNVMSNQLAVCPGCRRQAIRGMISNGGTHPFAWLGERLDYDATSCRYVFPSSHSCPDFESIHYQTGGVDWRIAIASRSRERIGKQRDNLAELIGTLSEHRLEVVEPLLGRSWIRSGE